MDPLIFQQSLEALFLSMGIRHPCPPLARPPVAAICIFTPPSHVPPPSLILLKQRRGKWLYASLLTNVMIEVEITGLCLLRE